MLRQIPLLLRIQPTLALAYWDQFLNSFWFLPLCLNLAAMVLGLGLPYLEMHVYLQRLDPGLWLVSTSDSARAILGALAGALITETTMIFSVTMVTLTLTATQYGSQPLRSFIRNSVSQLTLGMFLGTSIYCLLVLYSVREIESRDFIPHISVAVALIVTILDHLLFLYFLHQVATSIQSQAVAQAVATDLRHSIENLYPGDIGQSSRQENSSPDRDIADRPHQFSIASTHEGYLQLIDSTALMLAARKEDLIFRLETKPGDFIRLDAPLMTVCSPEELTYETVEHLGRQINRCFVLGGRRTPHQDVESAVLELVEVAVRALSPSINDPFTATICLDFLTANLSRLITRPQLPEERYDDEGCLRLLTPSLKFPHVLNSAFALLRQYGQSEPLILSELLIRLEQLQQTHGDGEHSPALLEQAGLIARAAKVLHPYSPYWPVIKDRYRAMLSRSRSAQSSPVELDHLLNQEPAVEQLTHRSTD